MKHRNCRFEHERQRNAALMRVYRDEIAARKHIDARDVYRTIVDRPAPRFWVSDERAAVVIAEVFRGGTLERMIPLKREMFLELARRAAELRQQRPELTVSDLARIVVRQPAPKFYLTPGSAMVIISRIKTRWYERRAHRPGEQHANDRR